MLCIINGKLYKRYDAKNGKPIPDGAIKCQDEPDPITGHMPCWVECNENNPSDKWFIEAYHTRLLISGKYEIPDGTYEAVSEHFQGNPYNYKFDTLIPHGKTVVEIERTFEGIKKYLTDNDQDEGLVFWDNDGKPACKIKRTDFGLKWGK